MADKMAENFPAAHSMDTNWWGVDDTGEIALFETGEEGCVPRSAGGRVVHWYSWEELYAGLVPDSKGLRTIPVDGRPLAAVCTNGNLAARLRQPPFNLVVVFASEDAVIPVTDSATRVGYRFSGPEVVVYYSSKAPIDGLIGTARAGGVIGLSEKSDGISRLDSQALAQGLSKEALAVSYDRQPDFEWILRYVGVHAYEHERPTDCYEAAYRPRKALTLSQLPIEFIRHTDFVRLPGVRFADAAAIQPMALTECRRWGLGCWVGADGSLHADQSFQGGILQDADGMPISGVARRRMLVRPVGARPASIDWQQFGVVRERAKALDYERRKRARQEQAGKRPPDE